jgi:ubiquinone/menaquinone biosynthesis C-methylase UbiE
MSPIKKYQNDDVKDTWDKVAENYEKEDYWRLPENHAVILKLLQYVGNPKNKSIIEVGCGSGFVSLALAERGAEISLLDISQVALDKAIGNFVECKLKKPKSYHEDALKSSVPSNSFDLVWNGGVIEHFSDQGKMKLIQEMMRMAKPGGFIVIMVPNRWCVQFQLMQKWMKLRKKWIFGFEDDMSPNKLKKMCKKMDIKKYDSYAFNPIQGWYWVPLIGIIFFKLLGGNNIKNHCKESRVGFVSVLVIKKDNSNPIK